MSHKVFGQPPRAAIAAQICPLCAQAQSELCDNGSKSSSSRGLKGFLKIDRVGINVSKLSPPPASSALASRSWHGWRTSRKIEQQQQLVWRHWGVSLTPRVLRQQPHFRVKRVQTWFAKTMPKNLFYSSRSFKMKMSLDLREWLIVFTSQGLTID